ncbi:MAG: M23 family metallopeptidase [Sphingomonadaceae bacterium]|jgi:murein DD-endopeptidase MepM/ murein hydrolase activator NlpD
MSRLRDLRERLNRIFADKEVFFRSGGEVRFLRISRNLQIGVAALLLAVLLAWLVATAAMLYNQASVAGDRAAMDAKAKQIAAEARKVNFFKRAADDIAADLDRRQNALDDMVKSQFGPSADAASVVGKADDAKSAPASAKKLSDATQKASASPASAVSRLKGIATRQTLFAQRLAVLIDQRSAKAEAAIRSFGLNPKQIASSARTAQGGPFIPWSQADIAEDEALSALAQSFARLNALEQSLAAIPSGRPTASPMLTSSYGYRRDPFNGRAAFHAGLDFPGSYGQPILAAAPGRVVYVGQRQGYGNVVEVDHGHGILTRYAHLSRFGVRPGALVQRGDAIARMGSTGRSTGTHLHFEVRVNGNAINPARFLEVRQDVLQVQQIAKQRIARVRSADEKRNVG